MHSGYRWKLGSETQTYTPTFSAFNCHRIWLHVAFARSIITNSTFLIVLVNHKKYQPRMMINETNFLKYWCIFKCSLLHWNIICRLFRIFLTYGRYSYKPIAPTSNTFPFSTKPGNGQNTSLHQGVIPVQFPKKHCVVLWPLSMYPSRHSNLPTIPWSSLGATTKPFSGASGSSVHLAVK